MYYQPIIFEVSKVDIIKIKRDLNRQIDEYIKKYLQIDISLCNLNSSILLLDEHEASIGISKISEFINLSFITSSSLFCFVVVDFDILTIEAQHSMLKVLEEPMENVLFLLFTTNLNMVLDTVKSRCQLFMCKHELNSYIDEKEMLNIPSIEKYLKLNYIDRYTYLSEMFLTNSNASLSMFIESFMDYLLKHELFLFNANNVRLIDELIELINHIANNKTSLALYLKYFNFLVFNLNI